MERWFGNNLHPQQPFDVPDTVRSCLAGVEDFFIVFFLFPHGESRGLAICDDKICSCDLQFAREPPAGSSPTLTNRKAYPLRGAPLSGHSRGAPPSGYLLTQWLPSGYSRRAPCILVSRTMP